ncbi:fructokinase [Bacillus sp. J14TS2]|uniref:carbohydrate kinase family protein n=1 Tax=Bacillus sp. J14TS2 TaxID=2807188 RepID=UPI001B08C2E3|nr:carbohydrate kinase family protein [Bacillus sp. J14TS2]GIN71459.1 fructokinase [Bacillus sp. J14TS2]
MLFKLNDKIKLKTKSNNLLAVGELLIDMISSDYTEDMESNSYKRFFGGSPSNIVMNAKKLGIQSLVAAVVGKDRFGEFLIQQLRNQDIETSYVQQVDYPTSMVVINKSKSTPVPIFYRGADYHITYTSKLEQALSNSSIVHFSCWPISMEQGQKTITKMLKIARENDILICFDPNYHPMYWQKGEDGVEIVKSFIRQVDIIKPSEDDAERLFGKDTPENQIDKFLRLGVKLVIMTLGKDGAIVSNGKETLRCHTFAEEVVDTTGAGDAFWSGFYAAIVKGYTIADAIRLGMGVSAFKLRYTGAVVDLPKIEEIKEIYKV